MEGELRISIVDPAGRPVPASVTLASRSPQFSTTVTAGANGKVRLQRLAPGSYQLTIAQAGFAPVEERVEVRSALPVTREVRLQLAGVTGSITVTDAAPLLSPTQPTLMLQAGRENLETTAGTTLGRSLIDVVTTMPGWLLEANAVLHPRGSEYDTQYVVDGMPLYDNRSIGVAPPFENNEFESVSILTGGIPAEYGRRMGGVIALDTRRTAREGSHTEVSLQGGSYHSYLGSLTQQVRKNDTTVSFGAYGGVTDRYLDPPSLENYTNHGSGGGFHAGLDQDLGSRDRVALYLRSSRMGFLVPNDLEQQEAGQRQDRRSGETAGQVHYQHTFSGRAVGTVRGLVRDVTAELWSNPLSTPVVVSQDRGFREGAITAAMTFETERHSVKFGGDFRTSAIRERFSLNGVFSAQQRSMEGSAFIQDHFRWGNFAANLGVRFDRYSLMIDDHAFSPRVALSYYVPKADLLLRASYDRAFQPPPVENLLLSSSVANPVPASRGNFFEVGIRKPFGRVLRLDATHYWRTFRNYLDDDVFLNTGISVPITFDTARVQGTEIRLEVPRWRGLSGFASYSNMLGTASSPVTGGIFFDGSGEAAELRDVVQRFPISQDQRNTVAAQIRFEPARRWWVSGGVRYGSGLPVELEDDDDDDDEEDEEEEHEQPVPPEILNRVNMARGRVSPNFSLDLSSGVRVWERDSRSVTLQGDVRNLTNRLNVINFTGLFSGTALAPGRQFTLQLRLRF